jgi:nucleoside-diphosphate-sugar epimerase
MKHLLCFGYGFSAAALVRQLDRAHWRVTATFRNSEAAKELSTADIEPVPFDGTGPLPDGALDGVTHVLVSIPPGKAGDPILQHCASGLIERAGQVEWLGYLSTTGVYGDRQGGWVDEKSPLEPTTARGKRRLEAEAGWLALHRDHALPVHIFRLAGIYGPGRNQLETVRSGKARRIVKPGQVFSRIHVDDIAGTLRASMAAPAPGRAYNVCDDEAAPPQDVIAFAAKLLNMPAPPEVAFNDAELSDMARSFYAESKRVDNSRIKQELGYSLVYPTYREGLVALRATLGDPVTETSS